MCKINLFVMLGFFSAAFVFAEEDSIKSDLPVQELVSSAEETSLPGTDEVSLEDKKIETEAVDESVVQAALDAANETRDGTVYEFQLPESDFSQWHTEKIPGFLTFGHKKCTEMPGSESAAVWDNGNPAYSASGSKKWPTQRAVLPDGSVGAKLITRKVFGTIASGNLFTGRVVRKMSLRQLLGFTNKDGKQLIDWGVPFKGRPSGFRVKYSYDGKGDECSIVANLENRTESSRSFVATAAFISTDTENKVNCPSKVSEPDENGLRTLEVSFVYGEYPENANEFPKGVEQVSGDTEVTHVNVVFASSAHGDYFEGIKNATLIVKDFEFIYE